MKKQFGKYYVGLDMGTDSIGWAVTDTEYKIQKLNGKAMWGVRLFEGGKTAEERRLFRSSRRRLQRRKQRLLLLEELFASEISKVDVGFYQRLHDSKYHKEEEETKYALFADKEFTDKEFHLRYPTIFHLRKDLIQDEAVKDIRLVYLALHHILKRRGHFLFEGENMESASDLKSILDMFIASCRDELEIDLKYDDIDSVENILKDRTKTISDKAKELHNQFNVQDKKEKSILNLIAGKTEKLSFLLDMPDLDDTEFSKLSFASGKYDEIRDQIQELLEDKFYIIDYAKAIYDWAVLADILQGYQYLSYSKVDAYEKHKKDLKVLKSFIRKHYKEEYKNMFVLPKKGIANYCAYIGMSKSNGKKKIIEKKCSKDEFYKYIRKIIDSKEDEVNTEKEYIYLTNEIDRDTLLPKQINKDNGVIPHQVHYKELEKILKNASKFLPFLLEVDDTGYSVKEKIEKLFRFRIPYYVGPLNDAHKSDKGRQCWIVKRSNEKIRPWNFEEVVDLESSAEKFIERMTNKCTYLIGADVLPKNSLLYSKFSLLNELNNIKCNGEDIGIEIKQAIYKELFENTEKKRRVTIKRLEDFLKSNGLIDKEDDISGIDIEIKGDLSAYRDFKRIVGERVKNTEMIEQIISWITLFGDDKKLLKKRIAQQYGSDISEQEIKEICRLKYIGWGRLSRELLLDIVHVDKATGEASSIISLMWETNNNLMQLLSMEFDYSNQIEAFNNKLTDNETTLTYELVDELYVSPAVKRPIWQSLRIMGEIEKIMGHQPEKIFIEMARSKEEKGKRTISRKTQLQELYKNCKEEKELKESLENYDEGQLRSKKLYLYFTQMGKCIYTGEAINLSDLYNATIYDIDHIYPQSYTKDDSLDNMVLAKRTANAEKGNDYPVKSSIQGAQRSNWDALLKKGFISSKKYERLTRKTGFSNDELAGFISRQLVETRQSTKAVADIIKRLNASSEVVYVKAGNVSDFRQKYEMVKVREINDFHHAKDAFLNIVVGNVYNSKFTSNPFNYINNNAHAKYHLNKMYDNEIKCKDSVAWTPGEGGTIAHIKKVMAKNNILFTRYSYEATGGIADQMPVKKGSGQLPLKSSDKRLCDIEKYGGFNKVAGAYFMLVEHTKSDSRIRTIVYVPIHLAKSLNSEEEKREYCKKEFEMEKPSVRIGKIKIDTLFSLDGFKMHLSGRSENRLLFKNANQLCLNSDSENYCSRIVKYLTRIRDEKKSIELTEYDKITAEENLSLYTELSSKLNNTIYNIKFARLADYLIEEKENFIGLSPQYQVVLLGKLLHIFQCNSTLSDLSILGGSKSAGLLRIQGKISNDSLYIINQSITGLFEQKIDLHTV